MRWRSYREAERETESEKEVFQLASGSQEKHYFSSRQDALDTFELTVG